MCLLLLTNQSNCSIHWSNQIRNLGRLSCVHCCCLFDFACCFLSVASILCGSSSGKVNKRGEGEWTANYVLASGKAIPTIIHWLFSWSLRRPSNWLCLAFATLETSRLGRANFRKDVWVQGENWPIAELRVFSNDPEVFAKVNSTQFPSRL